jgi:hypothetical protein
MEQQVRVNRKLVGHLRLIYIEGRPWSARIVNQRNLIHNAIISLGQSRCPFCKEVL